MSGRSWVRATTARSTFLASVSVANRFEVTSDGRGCYGFICAGNRLNLNGFEASNIVGTSRWRIDAVPGGTGTNRAPRATGSIPAQTQTLGGSGASVNVAQYFTDPDGDALTYTAGSSRTGTATAVVSGSTVRLTPVAAGTATVTVTARDPGGLSATPSIAVTVEDEGAQTRPPQPTGSIPAQTLTVGGRAASVSVAQYFTDPDGDALTYAARSSRTGIVTAVVAGSTVTLTPVAAGTATVTVTARDPSGASATQSIGVTVQAAGGVNGLTDDPLAPGVTPVRAVHFRELRTRIDVLRARAGLSAYAWTEPALTPGVTRVRSVHLTELRVALNQAFTAGGQSPPAYSDASVRAGTTPVRAAHITELRTAVVELENAAPTGLMPDLVAGPPTVDDNTLTPGQLFTLSVTVRNRGSARSAATTLRYYRSTNSTDLHERYGGWHGSRLRPRGGRERAGVDCPDGADLGGNLLLRRVRRGGQRRERHRQQLLGRRAGHGGVGRKRNGCAHRQNHDMLGNQNGRKHRERRDCRHPYGPAACFSIDSHGTRKRVLRGHPVSGQHVGRADEGLPHNGHHLHGRHQDPM